MLLLAQLLIVCGILLFSTMPVIFIWLAGNYLFTRKHGHAVLISGCFILGAVAGGFAAWLAVPSGWTLPFWKTLQATVDTETYTHAVEHYAEGIVLMMTTAALALGAVFAGAAAIAPRLRKKLAHA